jgi:hypothetical protein
MPQKLYDLFKMIKKKVQGVVVCETGRRIRGGGEG